MNYENQDGTTQDAVESPDISSGDLNEKIQSANLAEDMTDEELREIGDDCKTGFEMDLESRSEWEECLEEWTDLAKQTREAKSYPWPNASNIKYPLLSTAAMQFAARAYPSLVPSNGKVVKTTIIGKDPDGSKLDKADRVSTYMSYQVMKELSGWDEDMDKLLMMLPIVGTLFKKTYYDKSEDQIVSKLILPKNLVVNYWTKNLRECERISEIIEMSSRIFDERVRQKIFRDVDLGEPQMPDTENTQVTIDETTPYELVEQHTFLTLKDDEFAKPYIVTFERNSGEVLRISPRFNHDDVEMDEDGKAIKIKPLQMYTKFGFIPNPDGGFYDIGFGVLLGPLNESVNTIINQLVDAGSLSNLQSGFIGKGLRLKMGDSRFQPGEWKPVNATGDDLRKQIVPLPAKEPSKTLFELMGTLITSGKELASVAEIFVGKMPGQNTPATTTMATIEQGMKVFTAVYKRIFRSLGEEFDKIFDLNSIYLDPNKYVDILDITVGPDDFSREHYDICPGADPTAVSQTEKLVKAQGLMEIMQGAPGMLDPVQVISRILEAQEQPNWQQLFSKDIQQSGQYQPPPDPKMMAIQAKAQSDQQMAATRMQESQAKMELEARSKQQQMMMDAQQHAQEMAFEQQRMHQEAQSSLARDQIKLATEQMKGQQQQVASQQQLVHNEQAHQQQMSQQKEQAKLQSQSMNSRSGRSTPSQKTSGRR